MAPRWHQDGPKTAPSGPKCPQDGPKTPQGGSKTAPSGPKMAPRWPQDGPKTAQEAPRAPKRPPRGPQERPRGPKEAPKRPPRGRQEASQLAYIFIQSALTAQVCITLPSTIISSHSLRIAPLRIVWRKTIIAHIFIITSMTIANRTSARTMQYGSPRISTRAHSTQTVYTDD